MSIHPIMQCALLAGGVPRKLVEDISTISPHDQPTVPYAAHSGQEADLSSEGERPVMPPPDAARITRRDLAIMVARREELEAQVADLQNQIRAFKDASRKGGLQPNIPASSRDIAHKFSLDGMDAWVSVTPEGTVYMTADQHEDISRKIQCEADCDEDFVTESRDAITERGRSEDGYVKRKLKQDE